MMKNGGETSMGFDEFARRHGGNGAEVKACPSILLASDFVKGFIAPDFIIDGLIQRGFLYSLTARTGDGKTAWGIYTLVKHGSGLECDKIRILYLAGENPDDIRARVLMTCEEFGTTPDHVSAYFIPGTFNISEMSEMLKNKIEALGGVDIVMIDTSAAYFQGDEENSNTQLGAWARELRALCYLPGTPAVIVFCHPQKAAKAKSDLVPRGGGAFLAEMDGNLCLFSDDRITTELHWTGKLRGPGFEPQAFCMKVCTSELVKDVRGRLIPSVVAVPISDSELVTAQRIVHREQDLVLSLMLKSPSESISMWAYKLGFLSEKGEPQKSKMHRLLKMLAEHGLVKQDRSGAYRLTDKGKTEAEKVL